MDDSYTLDETMCELVELIDSNSKAGAVQEEEEEEAVPGMMINVMKKGSSVLKRKLSANVRLVEKLSEDGVEAIRKQWREMDTGSGGKDYESAQSHIRSFIDRKFSDIEIRQLLHIGSSRIQRLRHCEADSVRIPPREAVAVRAAPAPVHPVVTAIEAAATAAAVATDDNTNATTSTAKGKRNEGATRKRKLNAVGRLVEKLSEDGIEGIRKQWREMDTGLGGKDYESAQSYIRSFIDRKFSDIEIRQLLHIGSSRIQKLRKYHHHHHHHHHDHHHPVVDSTEEVMQQRSRQQQASAAVPPPPPVSDGTGGDCDGGDGDTNSPDQLLLDIVLNGHEELDQQISCVLSMS